LLLAGPWDRAEFAAIRQPIERRYRLPWVASLQAAATHATADATAIEAVLVAVPRPQDLDLTHLHQLTRAAPLLRTVLVAGTWCEGEWRTGCPPRGMQRIYWHELPAWLGHAHRAIACGAAPPWSQASSDMHPGSWAAPAAGACATSGSSVLDRVVAPGPPRDSLWIAIDAIDAATFEAVAQGLATAGWRSVWWPRYRPDLWPGSKPSGVFESPNTSPAIAGGVWVGTQLDSEEAGQLRRFGQRLGEPGEAARPLVVLLDFPRAGHLETVQEAGATTLLGKPYRLAALLEAIGGT
jgi:hypothetical protein